MNQEMIYHFVCILSSIICILMAFMLLDVRSYRKMVKEKYPQVIPHRYITARISLGIAYVILGGLTAAQTILEMPDETETFIPLSGLVIASSQALLFTMAILAFYNSKMADTRMVVLNVIPFACLMFMYLFSSDYPSYQKEIRLMWLVLYIVQLIVLTVAFYKARKKYLSVLHSHLGKSQMCTHYEQKELVPLFIGTLFIGIYALVSFFFTQRWMLSVFIVIYTIYYIAVGVYTLKYAEKGPLITDLSTSDDEFQE